MTRMIVEGMDYDNTKQNYVTYEDVIPPNATLLHTNFPHRQLSFVGKINIEGDLERMTLETSLECNIGYEALGKPESVQTIIAEDGRVFSSVWPNGYMPAMEGRTFRAIDDIKVAGGFELAYLQIQNDPGRFYSGAATINGNVVSFIPPKKKNN